MACIGQGVPARMSQHVRVDREWHFRPLAQPRDQRMEAFRSHRATSLSGEDVPPWRLLALQTPQGAYLITLHRMHARRPTLSPADMQTPRRQLDLMPLQIA